MNEQQYTSSIGIGKLFLFVLCSFFLVVASHGAINAKTATVTKVGFSVDGEGVLSSGAAPMENHSEGPLSLVDVDGQNALRLDGRPTSSFRYMYVTIDDQAIYDGPFDAVITMSYLAKEPGRFRVQFDSAATGRKTESSEYINIDEADVGRWISTSVSLPDVRFRNAQNAGGDLRIVTSSNLALYVNQIEVELQGSALSGADD